METKQIEIRYDKLAEDTCCLSCGGAVNHALPQLGEVCVDLGSGRGTDAIRMADTVGENGYVYGIDISESMIKKAKLQAEKLEIKNVSFIRSELESINLTGNLADVIISNCVLNHVSDKQAVWNEIYRILKDKGRFVVSDIYATAPVPAEYKNDAAAVAECWAGASVRNEYLNTIAKAGFTNIEILEESVPYDKGKIQVCSFTISGLKKAASCGCGCGTC